MTNPDFSGIDPLRVPEARRRIEAIEQYLRLPDAKTADAARISASIGLSRWQLQRLARVWREHRDPTLLVVGRRGASSRQYRVAPRAIEIAEEEIASAGADAELRLVAPRVERRCRAENVAPPSRPTIWNYIRKACTASDPPEQGPKRIVVGRMWFHLPVTDTPGSGAGTDMPTLLVAVALPERIILAHRISVDDHQPPGIADLIAELVALRIPGADGRPLLLQSDDRRAANAVLAKAGLNGLRAFKRSVQRELSRAFGGRLGRLTALYRRSLARPGTKHVVQRQDERITSEEAKAAILEAVAASDAASRTKMPAFDISVGDEAELTGGEQLQGQG